MLKKVWKDYKNAKNAKVGKESGQVNKKSILIIDDDERLLRALKMGLEKNVGFFYVFSFSC